VAHQHEELADETLLVGRENTAGGNQIVLLDPSVIGLAPTGLYMSEKSRPSSVMRDRIFATPTSSSFFRHATSGSPSTEKRNPAAAPAALLVLIFSQMRVNAGDCFFVRSVRSSSRRATTNGRAIWSCSSSRQCLKSSSRGELFLCWTAEISFHGPSFRSSVEARMPQRRSPSKNPKRKNASPEASVGR